MSTCYMEELKELRNEQALAVFIPTESISSSFPDYNGVISIGEIYPSMSQPFVSPPTNFPAT